MSVQSVVIGTLGSPGVARVDQRGTLSVGVSGIDLGWMIGTPQWRDAKREVGIRQTIASGAPVVTTRLAVGGGDLVQRSYGVAGTPPVACIEFENASREPVALALTITATPGARIKKVRGDGATLFVNELEALAASRPWQQWTVATDELALQSTLDAGATQSGPITLMKMRGQRSANVALIWPLPHSATLRVALPIAGAGRDLVARLALDSLPSADAVERGWEAQLERGMRIEIADSQLQRAVDGARAATLLLANDDQTHPDADDAAALEDWGYDHEAAAAWQRLSVRDRRRASQRVASTVDGWTRVKTYLAASPNGVPTPPTRFLRAVRDVVIDDRVSGELDLLPCFPPDWLGTSVAVHDAVTRHGHASFAVRWHGGRPALLWDVPAGVTVRASRLDPSWSTTTPTGEELLAEPSNDLLSLQHAATTGEVVAEPGSFF